LDNLKEVEFMAITINTDDLKSLLKETLIDVLTTRKDLIEDAVMEAIEDIGLGIAMEEGQTGEYVDNEVFLKELDNKIRTTK